MKNKNVVEIHVIQSCPASSMNRDGFQDVKTVEMGGTRTRLSSQSLKKVVRENCSKVYPDIMNGKLSLLWPNKVVENLVKDGFTKEDAIERVSKCFDVKKPKKGSTDGLKVSAAMYFTDSEINRITENCKQDKIEKFGKLLKDSGKNRDILSVAMFGRMFASEPDLSCDGAVSIAHAYTVHTTKKQEDYFVLIDELETVDNRAGHLQDNSFSAGVFYKFSKIDLGTLDESCEKFVSNDDIADACAEYISSFVEVLPQGKQRNFNSETLPSFIIIKMSSVGRMRNASSAFYTPLKNDEYVVDKAIKKLKEEHVRVDNYYGDTDTEIIIGVPGIDFTMSDIKSEVKAKVMDKLSI
jgi:CRISPR system Cascade subunit CasC